jgi:hypothetical protein
MFDTGRIALFMDGFDEMPDSYRDKAIERLAAETAGLRVTVTSRPDQYRATLNTGRVLAHTAVAELHPVDVAVAASYLLQGQIGSRDAWQQVAEHLEDNPDGILARTLNTPLTLSLARSAYSRIDPSKLLDEESNTEQALRGHLLDQVLVTAYPDPQGRDHATYWLGWIAHHMNTQPAGPTRDLRWWDIPNWLRYGPLLVGGLICIVVCLVVGALVGAAVGGPLGGGIQLGGLVGVVAYWRFALRQRARTPRLLAFRRPTLKQLSQGLRSGLRIGLLVGLASGGLGALALWLTFRREAEPELPLDIWLLGVESEIPMSFWLIGVTLGIFIGAIGGLIAGLSSLVRDVWSKPSADSVDLIPHAVYRKDLQTQLISGLLVGISFGLMLGLLFALTPAFESGLIAGLKVGLMVALAGALGAGIIRGLDGAAPHLLFGEITLRLRGRRVRFMPLLKSALDQQVLRQAGSVYQFRHADLQDRLAERHRQEHLE